MSFPRSIVHLDADAFFASVEQASDSRLRGKPIAVGGEKRGIIASASYEARKFGIYTPMPTIRARRLCPKLILLPGDFEKYELFSRLMFSYAYDFTPDVEIGSIDEGYFDLTGVRRPALGIAETISQAIRQALKLPVSEGVGANKLVSQIASKLKKPCALEFVPAGQEAQFLSPLANQWLPGVGPKTAGLLNAAGLAFIGQIAQTPLDLLNLLVGNQAPQLRHFARGLDDRPIVPVRAPAKSYGEQETFAADTTDEPFLEATLRRMADQLMAKVRDDGKSVRTLTVKVRYNDMDETQVSESLCEPTDLETDIYGKVSALLRKAWQRRVSLRLVSLKLGNVYDDRFGGRLALGLPERQHAAQQRLAHTVDELRQKFGRGVLLRGHDFVLRDKDNHGEEPQTGTGNPADARPPANTRPPAPASAKTPTPSLSPYQQAVVERQRLGNSFARISASPGPELRFRLAPQANSLAGLARAKRASHPSKIQSIPLNVHSYYSFLDSTLSLKAIVEFARRHELPAIALTDRNNLHGAVEFAQAAAAAGIKPVIGAELNWNGHRLCLYVQNQQGYQNLCRILNDVGRREPQKKSAPSARFPAASPAAASNDELKFEFENFTAGLIAVGPSAEMSRFFPQRFYLETRSLDAFEKHRRSAPALPCVASFPIHYEVAADRWKYNIVQSIRTLTLLRQAHPEKRLAGEYHFRTEEELRARFAAQPELLARSVEIAERCAFAFTFDQPQFPSYSPPDHSPPAAFLRRLALAGLRRRYPGNFRHLQPQLEEELAIITEVGYEEYFLVMWDILQECRRQGIDWITRGSAADSLVCYCLEISSVCPIRFDLYFRRFLNKDRMALNKLPDIDVDFPHDRKDDVIDLIFNKYPSEHTAVVGGFSTFQSRSAFAEVAKVLGVSEYHVRRLTERLPQFSQASELEEAVVGSLECRDLPLNQEPYSTALKMARFLDGFPRYPKMHPCGLVLSRQRMDEITPCFTSAKGYPTTHFDMDSVEAVGLIKMDILAQGGLAVMRDVKEMLEMRSADGGGNENEGEDRTPSASPSFDLSALEPWTDPRIWSLIAEGHARAVHHIESPAMISLCRMCNVRDIDTLIAIVSVIRPGAANESKKMEFARRYQGLSPVRYPHPSLESCLRSTYGLVVYEEHILQICEAFAGLPPGRADILRRALAKDKTDVIAQIQKEFIECARQQGRTETTITEVWELVAGFRGYAFCKAHSTAYGIEAYQSAWIKLHYPAQFMAAVLTNGKGFYSPLVYVLECHRLGIPLLPPSINEPGPEFMVVTKPPALQNSTAATASAAGSKIRVPVVQVKGLTTRTKDMLLQEHARGRFVSLCDFLRRVQPLAEEVEALIRVGAFDEFGKTRTAQFWEFKENMASSRENPVQPQKTKTSDDVAALPFRQLWLLPPVGGDRLPPGCRVEPGRFQRLQAEEELLGYPATGHPLELFPDIAWDTYCPVNRLSQHLGEQIVTCGLVIEQRLFHQVTGEPMKFLTLADWTGVVETELFAKTYQSYGLSTVRYRVLEIAAKVEPFENGRGYTLRVLRAGKPRRSEGAAS